MDNIRDLPIEKKISDSQEGTVKWWNEIQGMGYISANGEDYYINDKRPELTRQLKEGRKVVFDPYETLRGLEARNINFL